MRAFDKELVQQKRAQLRAAGLTYFEARSMAREQISSAIETAKARGRYDRGPLGEWVLSQPQFAPYFESIRARYRVTDEDIRAWWDLDEVERIVAASDDELSKIEAALSAMNKGLTPAQAGEETWRLFPYYVYEFGTQESSNARDELLPVELKPRIVDYVVSRRSVKHDFPTFNAWVRHALEVGDL